MKIRLRAFEPLKANICKNMQESGHLYSLSMTLVYAKICESVDNKLSGFSRILWFKCQTGKRRNDISQVKLYTTRAREKNKYRYKWSVYSKKSKKLQGTESKNHWDLLSSPLGPRYFSTFLTEIFKGTYIMYRARCKPLGTLSRYFFMVLWFYGTSYSVPFMFRYS